MTDKKNKDLLEDKDKNSQNKTNKKSLIKTVGVAITVLLTTTNLSDSFDLNLSKALEKSKDTKIVRTVPETQELLIENLKSESDQLAAHQSHYSHQSHSSHMSHSSHYSST